MCSALLAACSHALLALRSRCDACSPCSSRLPTPSSTSAQSSGCGQGTCGGVICGGRSVQQEAPLSARFKSQGDRPVIGSLSIIFGRSQILPSRPLFTVAYVINLFRCAWNYHDTKMEQQEVPLSARFKSQGVRPAIGCLSIIFGRSQILPSCPLFTVAYVINSFVLGLPSLCYTKFTVVATWGC